MDGIRFEVPGVPVPQGSKTVFNGRAVDANAKKLKPWRRAVCAAAASAAGDRVLEGPVVVTAKFVLPRPKGHFGTGRNAGTLRASSPRFPGVKPDLDKLLRALLDGVTDSGAWTDDSLVVGVHASKVYADHEQPGVQVMVWVTR